MNVPEFRSLFSIAFASTPHAVGDVPTGYFRRISAISGGTFEGERLRGKVLPGGGDWLIRRQDNVMHMDVRALLEVEGGALIYMTYTGRLVLQPGMTLPPAPEDARKLYFRSAVQFETATAELAWLNNIVAIGVGHFLPSGPAYDVFELL